MRGTSKGSKGNEEGKEKTRLKVGDPTLWQLCEIMSVGRLVDERDDRLSDWNIALGLVSSYVVSQPVAQY